MKSIDTKRRIYEDMTSKLRIVAAGKGHSMSLPAIVDAVLELVDKSVPSTLPTLVYLGTANYDNAQAFEAQTRGFKNKCRIVQLRVSERIPVDDMPTTLEIRRAIGSADIIMVSGGNTLYALKRWRKLGIDRMIRNAVYGDNGRAPVLCGGSAGAVCWFDQGHSDSMNPTTFLEVDPNLTEQQKKDWKYIKVEGLKLLPALCVPHHDVTLSNGQPRAQAANQFLLSQYYQQQEESDDESDDENSIQSALPPCIGIDEQAALVVANDMVHVVSGSINGKATCHVKHVVEVGVGPCKSSRCKSISVVDTEFSQEHGPIRLKDLLAGHFPMLRQ
ncbi:peptidase [Fragilaria crotonensis]|nr:peptidase [Fragilaria crotonensis]